MYSYNMYGNEVLRGLIAYAVTFSLVVAYSFLSYFIVKQIASENLSGIKDLLQMHGLQYSTHWRLLIIHALFFRSITSLMVTFALRVNTSGQGSVCLKIDTR